MARWTRYLCLLAALWASTAHSQDPLAPGLRPEGTAPAPGATTATGVPFDLWYLWGDDGKPVVVPDRVRVRDYLEWLARQPETNKQPLAYSISRVSCTGTAEEERLRLSVDVQVQTTSADDWVFVPLQMAEGTLHEPPLHKGSGEALPAPYQAETGYGWWFKGKGQHELTLAMSVPVRKQPAGRRVQLSLPPTAVSSLKLRVPGGRVTARSSERSIVTVRSLQDASEIEVVGLGTRLDLAWQSSPEPVIADTAFEVATSVTATLAEAERTATLEATQSIRALSSPGAFDEVRVTLPAGGSLVRVAGPDYRDHRSDPDHANRVVVKLKAPTTGPVELRWTVRTALPPPGEPFVIEGFDVDRAQLHQGLLAANVVGDFRLVQLPGEDKTDATLRRINPADLPASLRQSRTTTAYRFLNRLRIRLALQKVAPYVKSSAVVWLQVDSQGLDLTASYTLELLQGSIGEVSFRWPGWRESGWTVESVTGADGSDLPRVDEDSPDRLRVEFDEPVRRETRVEIRARRPLAAGTASFPISLPVAETAARSPTLLAILSPQNIAVTLEPEGGTVARPQADEVLRSMLTPDRQGLHREGYRIESAEAAFTAAMVVHPREVATSTAIEASQRPGTIAVRQRIAYDVAFGALSHLRLSVPRGLKPGQLHAYDSRGRELPMRGSETIDAETRIPIDPPGAGPFEVELRYAVETPISPAGDAEQSLTIPIVAALDAEFQATQFQWRDAAGRDATLPGDDWTRVPDPEGGWSWILPHAAREIAVVVSRTAGAWRGAAVSRALIRSTIGGDGTIHTRSEYRLTAATFDLSLEFAPGVQPIAAYWDRRELKLPAPQTDPDGGTRYRIVPDRSAASELVLTVDSMARGAPLPRFYGALRLTAPQLPENLPILDCRWLVTLPSGQHLFAEPPGFAPEYHWRRSGLFWSRQPDQSVEELEAWVRALAPAMKEAGGPGGNTYLFGRAGTPTPLAMSGMSQSAIVLIGAGTALALGWLLVKWPRARHVLTPLVLGFALSLVSVWFAPQLLLLAQAAVLGTLLAIVAAATDAYRQRRVQPIPMSFSSPGGFAQAGSSVARGLVISAGSNEYTTPRAPAPPPAAIESAGEFSESGSRT